MKKYCTIYAALLFAALLATSGLFASPQIMKTTKNGKKVHFVKRNGKRVQSCIYCHSGTGIKKSKQGFRKGQPRYRSLKRIQKCGGSGCHL